MTHLEAMLARNGLAPDHAQDPHTIALDALRKIALGHPCDLPVNIARVAIDRIKEAST